MEARTVSIWLCHQQCPINLMLRKPIYEAFRLIFVLPKRTISITADIQEIFQMEIRSSIHTRNQKVQHVTVASVFCNREFEVGHNSF